jgi:hypothetical protein
MRPPTTSVGLGLLFKHSVIRVELNYVLPLHMLSTDQPTSGKYQLGLGLHFLWDRLQSCEPKAFIVSGRASCSGLASVFLHYYVALASNTLYGFVKVLLCYALPVPNLGKNRLHYPPMTSKDTFHLSTTYPRRRLFLSEEEYWFDWIDYCSKELEYASALR